MRDIVVQDFVKEVEQNPALYDFTNPCYNNRPTIDKIWTQIGEKFGESALECKAKWRIIRSSFIRSLNYKCRPGKEKKSEYYLSQHLQFLNPFIKVGKGDSGDPLNESKVEYLEDSNGPQYFEENVSENNDTPAAVTADSYLIASSDSFPEVEAGEQVGYQQARKRRKQSTSYQNHDHCEMFLLSLAPHMRTLPADLQLRFQRKVLEVLENISYSKVKPERRNSLSD